MVQEDIRGPNILFGKFSSLITKRRKEDKWQHIADEINRINGKGDRTATDVKKKYQNSSADTRNKERARKKHRSGTGGGPQKKFKFSDSENLILAAMAEEQISGISGGIDSQTTTTIQSSQDDIFSEAEQSICIVNTYNSDPEISFDRNPRVQNLIESETVTTKTRLTYS